MNDHLNHSGCYPQSNGSCFYILPKETDVLHHGRLHQQWGVRNGPPYPLQITNSAYKKIVKGVTKVATKFNDKENYNNEKIAYKKKKIEQKKQKKADKKYEKEQKAIAKANEKNEKEKTKTKKEKEKAVRHNSYEELYKIKDKLSYNELQEAMNRIDLEYKLYSKAYPQQKVDTIFDKMKRGKENLDTVNNFTKSMMNSYNNLADIMNHSKYVQDDPSKKWIKYGQEVKNNDNDKDKNKK